MLNIVCALHCEAISIIENYNLKLIETIDFFPIYIGNTINLIISGVGKLNATAAVNFLAGLKPQKSSFLNIGIAGHKTFEIGSCFLADKIFDDNLKKSFYPDICKVFDFNTFNVTTINQPSDQYLTNTLFDMEASSFYQSAQRFTSLENIQVLKIISDNEQCPHKNVNKTLVKNLIQQNLTLINQVVENMLKTYEKELNVNLDFFLKHCHFSQTEKHRLKRLLTRLHAVKTNIPDFKHLMCAKEILSFLEITINKTPLCFTPSTTKKK